MAIQLRRTYLSMETTSCKQFLVAATAIRNLNWPIRFQLTTKKKFSHSKQLLHKYLLYSIFSKTFDSFSMNDSSFLIHKFKESTGRVVMFKEYNIINSYTLECSLCGPSIGARKEYHYSKKMLFVIYLKIMKFRIWENNFVLRWWSFQTKASARLHLKNFNSNIQRNIPWMDCQHLLC